MFCRINTAELTLARSPSPNIHHTIKRSTPPTAPNAPEVFYRINMACVDTCRSVLTLVKTHTYSHSIPATDPNAAEVFYRINVSRGGGSPPSVNALMRQLRARQLPTLLLWGQQDPCECIWCMRVCVYCVCACWLLLLWGQREPCGE